MWFKKVEVIEEPYTYGVDVSFDVAFKALREGYTIKHSNYDACLKYLNGRVYEMMDRDDNNCFEISEFSVFDMMIDKWQVLPLNCINSSNQ